MSIRRRIPWLIGPLLILAPPTAFTIEFEDATEAAGVEYQGETYGASWGDLDGDGLPDLFVSNHRSPPSLFLNRGDGTFVDVASQTFVWTNRPNADTHGGSWFDFNNDGSQDLLVTRGFGNTDTLLSNDRGMLVLRSNSLGLGAGVSDRWASRLPIWLDYDGDGLPDLIMTTMIVQNADGEDSAPVAQVMRQVPGGGFELQTDTVGMTCARQQYLQLLDTSGDGRLDVICPDGFFYPQKVYGTLPTPWEDRTAQFPRRADGEQFVGGPDAVVADFDNNGHVDIFHLSGTQPRPSGASLSGNRIEALLMGGDKGFDFESPGSVTFELDWNFLQDDGGTSDVGFDQIRIGAAGANPSEIPFVLDSSDTETHGEPATDLSMTPELRIWYDPGTTTWQVRLRAETSEDEAVFSSTYFQVTGSAGISNLVEVGLAINDHPARPTLLMNDGGSLVDMTEQAGFSEELSCVSVTAGDFDNDMWVDLYLACRTPTNNIENILYRNLGDGTFERVADAGGAAGPVGFAIGDAAGTADSVVAADYDGDGFLDLFVTNGFNLRPHGTGGPNKLFRNRGNDNNWVQLDLVGVETHREAVGTVVRATARTTGAPVQTRVKNGSYHRWSHDHTRMHFGLASADSVDLRIEWPSGTVDEHEDVPEGRVYRAIEGGGLEVVELGDGLPYPCGIMSQVVDADAERGVYLVKECTTGTWQLRMARGDSGGDNPVYSGRILSTSPMEGIRGRGLQPHHTLQCDDLDCPPVDGMASEIRMSFEVRPGAQAPQGFDFRPEHGSNTCITIDAPADIPVFLGPFRQSVPSTPFYLETLEPCPDGVPEEPLQAPRPPDDDDTSPSNPEPPDDGAPDNGNGDSGDGSNPQGDGGGSGGGAVDPAWLLVLGALLAWRGIPCGSRRIRKGAPSVCS